MGNMLTIRMSTNAMVCFKRLLQRAIELRKWSSDEYFEDIAVAYRQDLYALGCRNIQIDDPLLAYFCAASMLEGYVNQHSHRVWPPLTETSMAARGIDRETLFDTYIRAINKCIEGRPADSTVGLHLCRGNFKDGLHFSERGYDRIAIKLSNEINVDRYYVSSFSSRIQPL